MYPYQSNLVVCLIVGILVLLFMSSGLGCQVQNGKITPSLGHEMRSEFLLEENFIQLNHGSYGTYPKVVQAALHEFQLRAEKNPEKWIRRDARIELDKVRRFLGEYLNADENDLVVVPNTTGGINAIFRSMAFLSGEKILHFDTIYGAMRQVIKYICDSSNGNVTSVVFAPNYPISDDKLVARFEEFLTENHKPTTSPIRIALIDHISSVPGVINPIHRFIPMLKERNITVLVDGAHAIGQIPINLTELDADYYITNCHKWLYSARGSAVLYVRKELQLYLHPTSISFDYSTPSKFQDEFFWTGTIDYSPFMTIPAALKFRKTIGEDAIRNYTHELAINGGRLVAKRLGTRILQEEYQVGSIIDVELPIRNPEDKSLTPKFWLDTLLERFNLFCPPYKYNGRWWLRISSQIYNDLSDFETAANVFGILCNEINN